MMEIWLHSSRTANTRPASSQHAYNSKYSLTAILCPLWQEKFSSLHWGPLQPFLWPTDTWSDVTECASRCQISTSTLSSTSGSCPSPFRSHFQKTCLEMRVFNLTQQSSGASLTCHCRGNGGSLLATFCHQISMRSAPPTPADKLCFQKPRSPHKPFASLPEWNPAPTCFSLLPKTGCLLYKFFIQQAAQAEMLLQMFYSSNNYEGRKQLLCFTCSSSKK